MGSFSYTIWRKEGANIQASLLSWPALSPLPANLFFNLSGAVPASCWGPHLDHGGSRLQSACPRPDSKGNNPHVWRPHKPGETHRHSAHVAQHFLECCWGWAYPVRAWGMEGGLCLPFSHCMLALHPISPYCFLPQVWFLPFSKFQRHLSAQGACLWTYNWEHLLVLLSSSPLFTLSYTTFRPGSLLSPTRSRPPLGFHIWCSLYIYPHTHPPALFCLSTLIVSSITPVTICSFNFIYMLVYLFVCITHRTVNCQSSSSSPVLVVFPEPTLCLARRGAWYISLK